MESKIALIESHIHDQGGFSYCSNCNSSIDIYRLDDIRGDNGKLYCPSCKVELEFGSTTIGVGGHDF